MRKLIEFEQLKAVCEDKKFENRSGFNYFIKCKRGIPFCNERVCPVWNDLDDEPEETLSLREINRRLHGGNNAVSKEKG